MAQVKKVAVRVKNKAVNRVKLNTLNQDKGELIRRFEGRIRSLATVSKYALRCIVSCKNSCKNQELKVGSMACRYGLNCD